MSTDDPREHMRRQRLRRAAKRQGLVLTASRRRDPRALDYLRYHLDTTGPAGSIGPEFTLTLDEVEARLLGDEDDEDAPRAA